MNRIQQKQNTRRKLIEAALAMSADRGFSSLSLREVAKTAGIAATGFYRHFRDLDELGLVLVDEVAIALRRLIREARRRSTDKGRLRTSIETFLDYVRESPHHFRLLLGERLGGSAAFREALHKEIAGFVGELSDDLAAQAKASGMSAEHVPLAAEAIVAVVFTVGAEALDLPRSKHDALADRLIGEVKLIMRGAGFESRSIVTPAPEAKPARPARVRRV